MLHKMRLVLAALLLSVPAHAQTPNTSGQSYVYFDGAFGWNRPYVRGPVTLMGWAVGCDIAVVDVQLVVDGYRIRDDDPRFFVSFLFRRADVRDYFTATGLCRSGVPLYSGVLIGFVPSDLPGAHTVQLYIKDSLGRESYSNAKAYVFRD